MNSNRTLSIHQPEDFLGYIPHMLGYWPEDSLVAITLQGKVLGATLRVDLPAGGSQQALDAFADHVRSYLIADEDANGVVLAVYTDAGWTDGSVVRQTIPLLEALEQSLDQVDLSVRDAWLVGSEYWRGAYCSDEECCPDPGLPVDRIKDSRLSAEMVYQGSSIGPSPASGFGRRRPAMPAVLDSSVQEAESRYEGRLLGGWRSEVCLDAVLAVWQHVLDSGGQPAAKRPGAAADVTGFLRATLKVPAWRDAVAVMAAAGIESAKSGAEAFGLFTGDESDNPPFDPRELGVPTPGIPTPAMAPTGSPGPADAFTYGDVLLGMQPEMPHWSHLDVLHHVLAGLCVDDEPGEVAAAAWTLRGWISWCKGSGSIAHACLTRAELANPGYRLAELLSEILGQGTICAWARRPGSAWRGSRNAIV
ncbi:DUF4192 domain-containing protein [Paenarthrobacter aurescens]|uniref:DUF4192 domain-containing protein n=1 Tax=Paenarthrobacter aurescens TaxID=43663 RepID=UPI0021C10AE6|nr:DUF4192 domain-containing protein [Paenarthrobacter aurescens]MCT9871781.1 DUF4192 domain-containing protein [Paenarthrobacter aurescens]